MIVACTVRINVTRLTPVITAGVNSWRFVTRTPKFSAVFTVCARLTQESS